LKIFEILIGEKTMFIKVDKSGYTNNGEQYSSGLFLVLMQSKNDRSTGNNLRAIVRMTALVQFGHFMMGIVRIKNKSLTVSGSYGSDGLPLTVDEEIYNMGIPLPDELYNAWANGGGWNSAGNESKLMRDWALKNLDQLRAKR
jgi:hypothetical protein